MRRRGVVAALSLGVAALCLGVASLIGAPAGLAAPNATAHGRSTAADAAEASQQVKVSVKTLLDQLAVEPENGTGYDRDLFPHWDYVGDGCDVRDAVLIDEARRGPRMGDDCDIERGRWYSKFDGVTVHDPSALDIDHLVALSEAWASGARDWTESTRRAYANDLGYNASLMAVTASSNRSKGDQDPAEWLPPRHQYRCTYVATWIAVKYRWSLSIDERESAALRVLVEGCAPLRVVRPARAPTAG